ncbi:hypothetical protein N9B73_12380 [Verrucomicrobiales bacterium]|jgi:hypothetical protein|nr:hypothetical protein [Verrucomicrobiales bacterium]|tara:strand:- start:440 stop:601 length:162 start_codon:yes stop_codon:yes gene_type:complete
MKFPCPHERCGATITVPTPASVLKREHKGIGEKIEDLASGLFSKKKKESDDGV